MPIGHAICVCQYLDSGIRSIGRRIEECFTSEHTRNPFYAQTLSQPSGRLVRSLSRLVECYADDLERSYLEDLSSLTVEAAAVFQERNKIVHSHSYTTVEGVQGRLYESVEEANTYLDPASIEMFIQRAASCACRANELCTIDD